MKKHTQAPWTVEVSNAHWISYIIRGGAEGNKIAQTFNWQDKGFDICSEANAKLISAAPDLLEALEYMLVTCPPINEAGEDACAEARAEINKAEGIA